MTEDHDSGDVDRTPVATGPEEAPAEVRPDAPPAAHASALPDDATAAADATASEPTEAGGETAEARETGESGEPAEARETGESDESGELDDSGEPDDSGETSESGETTAAPDTEAAGEGEPAGEGGPEKKKRRRRRRRKKGGAEGAEATGETTATGETFAPRPERDRDRDRDRDRGERKDLPFMRFFEGPGAARRHAFSVGEVVAGRVERFEEGTIVVDLFGKATAVVDQAEPREIPIFVHEPEPPPVAAPAEAAPGADAGAAPAEADAGAAPVETAVDDAPAETAVEAAPPADELGGLAAEVDDALEQADGERPSVEMRAIVAVGTPSADTPPATIAEAVSQAAADAAGPEAGGAEAEAEAAAGAEAVAAESEADGAEDDEVDAAPVADAELDAPEFEGPAPELPSRGSIFRGRVGAVSESGHIALVNRLIDREQARKAIERARDQRRRVNGIVFGFNRGGFDVLVRGLRAFCPASGMSLVSIPDPNEYVGKKLEFLIPPHKGGGQGIVVSRRSLLERESRKHARALIKSLEPGQRLKGVITEVRDYGVLVDIGDGVEGLVHSSEVGWQRGVRPSDVCRRGDEVEVEVLKVTPATRKERMGRISLSLRATQPDPWDQHKAELEPGSYRKGKIVSTTEFGAFIEIVPGIEGLLHISELGRDLKHADQAVKVGEEIDIVIERTDRKQRRISLSRLSAAEAEALKAGELDPASRPRSMRPGTHVKVVVDRVEHGGVLVHVKGVLGRRGRGFIPNRELGTSDHAKKSLPGKELDVKIIGTDRDGGLRCSVRAKLQDEERQAVSEYRREAGKQGLGTFADLLRAKLGGSPPKT